MEPLLYHSFNARNLTLNEVANSFISNSQFTDLISLNHSLLLGPRGCGKTTLLKMLSPKAISIWNNSKNHGNKTILPFYGVYIPTDNQWKKQLTQLEKKLSFSPDFTKKISEVIVNTNVAKSIVNTFSQLLEDIDEDNYFFKCKRELCIDLIEILHLEKPISPDLFSVELALANRIRFINEFVNKIQYTKTINYGNLPDFFYSDFYDICSSSFLAFKKNFSKHKNFTKNEFRWALCFDELELAPEWLQDNLIKQLRSKENQTIIYKLTSTPIIKIEKSINDDKTEVEASSFNDYNIIRAWTYDQNGFSKWNDFARDFASNILKKKFNIENIENVFGLYDIERVIKTDKSFKSYEFITDEDLSWDSSYKKGTLMWYVIKQLAINDKTFREYLEKNGISMLNPVPKNESQMGKIFRKMKPIVIFRTQFIKNNIKRPRKNIPFYFGLNNIFEICDGNPRFLSGMIEIMLKEVNSNQVNEITPERQSEIIYKISERYIDIISSHPDACYVKNGVSYNLYSLIKRIGGYFFDELINNDFTINPSGSFVVDKDVNNELGNLIDLGIRLGAFVYINPKEAISETGIYNKSFRLSYLMHPYFKLPIREYRAINLNTILRIKKNNNELDLFSEEL